MQLVLKDIIGDLLDEGRVTQARRLSVLFGISTTDLDIVLVSTIDVVLHAACVLPFSNVALSQCSVLGIYSSDIVLRFMILFFRVVSFSRKKSNFPRL